MKIVGWRMNWVPGDGFKEIFDQKWFKYFGIIWREVGYEEEWRLGADKSTKQGSDDHKTRVGKGIDTCWEKVWGQHGEEGEGTAGGGDRQVFWAFEGLRGLELPARFSCHAFPMEQASLSKKQIFMH